MWPDMSRPSLDPASGCGVAFRELTEDAGEAREVGKLARRRRLARLGEPVDPHVRDAELRGGDDVVKVRGRRVDVRQPTRSLLERTPVPEGRLVGGDLGGDDRELEVHA